MGKQAAASADGKILKHVSEEEGHKILMEAASEEEKMILKHSSEDKILKLDSLMLESEETVEDRQGRILWLDSEEDRKILLKVKSEEGKILKLKKEYEAVSYAGLLGVSHYIPMVKLPEPPRKEKTKKVVVVKTLVPRAYIALIKAMPCPVTSPVFNLPDSFHDSEEVLRVRRLVKAAELTLRDYHQALVDQYERFGFAVDETELTDDEDEENTLKN